MVQGGQAEDNMGQRCKELQGEISWLTIVEPQGLAFLSSQII